MINFSYLYRGGSWKNYPLYTPEIDQYNTSILDNNRLDLQRKLFNFFAVRIGIRHYSTNTSNKNIGFRLKLKK